LVVRRGVQTRFESNWLKTWVPPCSSSRRTGKQESSSHEGSSEDESDDDNDVSWFHFTTMAAQINVLLSLIYDKLPENKLIIWILFRCWATNSYSFDLGTCKEGCCQKWFEGRQARKKQRWGQFRRWVRWCEYASGKTVRLMIAFSLGFLMQCHGGKHDIWQKKCHL